jgi:hypothetical protein
MSKRLFEDIENGAMERVAKRTPVADCGHGLRHVYTSCASCIIKRAKRIVEIREIRSDNGKRETVTA